MSSNNTQKSIGGLCSDGKIVIPIIQRDYAQGREDQESKSKRYSFIKKLKTYITDNNKRQKLDFIYGSQDNDRYIILDGQQRLTTLFLIYRYFAWKEGKSGKFKEKFDGKFSYETRDSATQFCDSLINEGVDITVEDSLSEQIKESAWYFLSWNHDPTVKGMLIMLDTINDEFKDIAEEVYDKLDDIFTFDFLDTIEYKIADDLYIKMNATGLPLSDFENFKAELERKWTNDDSYSYANFAEKIDTTWLDFIWEMSGGECIEKCDKIFINIFHLIFANQFFLKSDDSKNGNIEEFKKIHPFSWYDERMTIDTVLIEKVERFLDRVICVDKDLLVYDYLDNMKHFKYGIWSNLKENITYAHRLRFYAYFEYMSAIDYDIKHLDKWMRVICNLTENTQYDNVNKFQRDLISIESLIKNSAAILGYLAENSNNITSFDTYQREEERLKAKLLISNYELWYPRLTKAEKHDYFKGQIGFLLNISDITPETILDNNEEKAELFDINYNIATKIFKKTDLDRDYLKDHVWERALLSLGDYLIHSTSGNNKSFCSDLGRDTPWKCCLRMNNEVIYKIFKIIREDYPDFSKEPAKVLNDIIEKNKSSVNDWRRPFIECGELFKYFDKGYFFIRPHNDTVLLLKRKQLNGYYAELISLYFFITKKDELEKYFGDKWKVNYNQSVGCIKNTKGLSVTAIYEQGDSKRINILKYYGTQNCYKKWIDSRSGGNDTPITHEDIEITFENFRDKLDELMDEINSSNLNKINEL